MKSEIRTRRLEDPDHRHSIILLSELTFYTQSLLLLNVIPSDKLTRDAMEYIWFDLWYKTNEIADFIWNILWILFDRKIHTIDLLFLLDMRFKILAWRGNAQCVQGCVKDRSSGLEGLFNFHVQEAEELW